MENCLDQIKNIFSESNKTKVAIVGKGSSLSQIQLERLKEDYYIIALNDTEVFLKPDMTVFYRTDLLSSLAAQGFRSDWYLAPRELNVPQKKHLAVSYFPMDQEGLERIYAYFYAEDFFILDFTLLSAIKLAMIFQQVKKVALDIVFLGFDFYIASVRADDMQGLEYRNAHLRTQESIYITLIRELQSKNALLNFQHIGAKKYSTKTVEDFNKELDKYIFNGSLPSNSQLYQNLLKSLDETNKVIVVAEFTNNHVGDRNRLLKMIELAAESGADMIKVQKRDVGTFYTEQELDSPYSSPFGTTLREYRSAVELDDELFTLLDAECRKRNIPWFASALDWNSYLYLQKFDCPMIKLPSTISEHKNYLRKVADNFKGELVISTGFTDQSYENFVLQHLIRDKKLFLLQCTSSYPTPPEGCQIAVVRHYEQLRERYPNIVPGYSSHDLGSLGCMMAIAAGARMVEKHVKLGDLEWVHFDSVAIDLYNNQFKNFVNDIRKAEVMCGTRNKKVYTFEHHKYQVNDNVN
ncbi:N-acetylneuraminate synthase family protein [Sphingobacterium corticibacterium]|uniref:N-acetylneuraminate synthase n=1 Tax=Sphingobacterium corticibacterium TaxID=2484746 RepID=A0A4Q6XP14_9SPHI|nr:N-acetylneuraminate synthase family protein [Sphingobacterium corticibacterium]RZF61671.1 N-acetylneuraminate synthase [Sphingobacterium corticibacterium]